MIKFRDAFSKTDWIKIGILVVVAAGSWIVVYDQFKEPIVPSEWYENPEFQLEI